MKSMYIKVNGGFSVSVENTNFIVSIYNIGEKLFFLYGYNGSGQPIRVYKSAEEAREVVSRICEEMARGSDVYELPQAGFLA